MRHVISILLQNESGALARVASMFATRGFNIESLSVAPTTTDETISRVTLVTSGQDEVIDQINKQLAKLVDVVASADLTLRDHFERELGLLKFAVSATAEDAFLGQVRESRARVLDDHPEHFTVELTAREEEIDRFLEETPSGVEIVSVVRSGPLVISRGPSAVA